MSKLPEPYASPPGRPGKYALYISRHRDDDTQSMCVVFAEPYAARKFLDILLEDDGLVWDDESTVRSETGIVVSTRWYPKRMRECVEHEYTLQEMAWTMEPPQTTWARTFRHGPSLPRTLEEDHGSKPARERREKRSGGGGPRADAPAGSVHVSDVALSMGIDAKQARVALRKLVDDGKLVKAAYGWWWPPSEVEGVKAKIKSVLK